MSWAESLIKISTYEVEVLQKRLGEIVERRLAAEAKLEGLHAEGEAEAVRARQDAAAGWYHVGFLEGLRMRKAAVHVEIAAAIAEERGARDALAEAFETQKKYELVAETAKEMLRKDRGRQEANAFDELGIRRAKRSG